MLPGFKRDLYEKRQYQTEILHTFIRVLMGLKVQNYFEKNVHYFNYQIIKEFISIFRVFMI